MLIALGMPQGLASNKASERHLQRQSAEVERAELQRKLGALKREIQQTEKARGHAADALAQSEAAISEAKRDLHELASDQRALELRIKELSAEQDRLVEATAKQQGQLARVLRDQYVAGKENRLKLLLSGDNPNRINRDLQYMGYLSQAQAKLIDALRSNLAAVEANQSEAEQARVELQHLAEEQRQLQARLQQKKEKHSVLLAELSSKLKAQRKEAGNIERDEQRLAGLVDRLTKLIEEQRKAEAAAREKLRREQMARAQQRRESSRKPGSTPDAIEDDAPQKLARRNELMPEPSVQDADRAFASLRGQLRLPVRGELVARYGSKRGDGPNWKGLFIRTEEGAEVRAVAPGQVVFADWLRGFGNLIIVDHGGQYMTIYGNNQSVLKRVGDRVNAGDTIASAGSSGGNEQSGLYFEMRHQGRAIDPAGWILIR